MRKLRPNHRSTETFLSEIKKVWYGEAKWSFFMLGVSMVWVSWNLVRNFYPNGGPKLSERKNFKKLADVWLEPDSRNASYESVCRLYKAKNMSCGLYASAVDMWSNFVFSSNVLLYRQCSFNFGTTFWYSVILWSTGETLVSTIQIQHFHIKGNIWYRINQFSSSNQHQCTGFPVTIAIWHHWRRYTRAARLG